MLENTTVAIIGLGLLGGSLARDLAARGARVLGWDRDPATRRAALASGALSDVLSPTLAELADADVLILAVPVEAAAEVLATARPHVPEQSLITDVGSTKRSTLDAATALGLQRQFVGAHPLAGDHRAGWDAARTGLFQGARVYLCPTPETRASALQSAEQLWRELGAEPITTTADQHDRLLAATSHLPQAVAFLLAAVLADAGIPRADLGPGGRDTLRLAASPPPLWTGIALDNAAPLRAALARLRTRITELEATLHHHDEPRVLELFTTGHQWFTSS